MALLNQIYEKVMSLEAKVSELDKLVKIRSLSPDKINQNIDEPKELPEEEQWRCEKCTSKLGFFDSESGGVRVKHGGMTIYWEPAPDGSLTIICHNCSFINKLEYNLPNDNFNDNISLIMEKDNG